MMDAAQYVAMIGTPAFCATCRTQGTAASRFPSDLYARSMRKPRRTSMANDQKVPGLEQTESQPGSGDGEVPLPSDDEGPFEEEMEDVQANNSVSAEHPQPR